MFLFLLDLPQTKYRKIDKLLLDNIKFYLLCFVHSDLYIRIIIGKGLDSSNNQHLNELGN